MHLSLVLGLIGIYFLLFLWHISLVGSFIPKPSL